MAKSAPLISIIIPTYNAAVYIKEAVDSALSQIYKNIEIIVVDDGSADNTRNVLETYIRDKKIIYVYQENRGLAGARNAGIRNSKGEYVVFLDADDLFLPQKVEEQVRVLEENSEFDVCYSDLLHFTDSEPKKFYHHRYRYTSGNILRPLLWKQFINPISIMVRRVVFNKYGYFNENLRRSEDWDLWLRWSHAGVKFYYLDKVLAHYRIRNAGNLSSVESEPEMKDKNLELFSKFGQSLTKAEWQEYGFDDVLNLLKLKVVFAYLLVGNKKVAAARAGELSLFWRLTVALFPGAVWRVLLGLARQVKHRLLLKSL